MIPQTLTDPTTAVTDTPATATRQRLAPSTPTRTPSPPPAKVVDLSTQLGPGWQLVVHHDALSERVWHLQHDATTVGSVRRDVTTTGRRGWRASINGIVLPAHGHLAVAAGPLWRSRDLAAAAIAHHLHTHPRRHGRQA